MVEGRERGGGRGEGWGRQNPERERERRRRGNERIHGRINKAAGMCVIWGKTSEEPVGTPRIARDARDWRNLLTGPP